MFKRIVPVLLALLLCLCATVSLAEEQERLPGTYPISEMSVEELLDLRLKIDAELIARGYIPFVDLEKNDKGDAVVRVQERLTELGFYTGKINGKLDNETQKAMKMFEKANNLKNDGVPSREDQIVLFSEEAVGKVAPATPTPKVTATPDPMAEVYAQYGSLDYTDCARYPEKHNGEKVTFRGKVLQVLGNRKEGFQVRISATGSSDDVIYLFIVNDPGYNILDNDRLTVYARLAGTVTYKSTMGQSITIPAAYADYIILR